MKKLRPLGSRVLVQKDEVMETFANSFILRPENSRERSFSGVVIDAGPGEHNPETGEFKANTVQPGDRVLFDRYSGTTVKYDDGTELLLLNRLDLIARLEIDANH